VAVRPLLAVLLVAALKTIRARSIAPPRWMGVRVADLRFITLRRSVC
jgi:hypothetical protein